MEVGSCPNNKAMTKEQFLFILKQPEIPMEVWFEYYRERGGTIADFEKFVYVFSVVVWNEQTMVGSDGNMKQVTIVSSFYNFHDYYSKKFNLWQEEI